MLACTLYMQTFFITDFPELQYTQLSKDLSHYLKSEKNFIVIISALVQAEICDNGLSF